MVTENVETLVVYGKVDTGTASCVQLDSLRKGGGLAILMVATHAADHRPSIGTASV